MVQSSYSIIVGSRSSLITLMVPMQAANRIQTLNEKEIYERKKEIDRTVTKDRRE